MVFILQLGMWFFTSRLFLSLWQCIWEIQIVAMLFGNVGLVVFTLNLWWCSFKVQVVGVLLLLIMLIHLENGCCFGFVIFFINLYFFWKYRYFNVLLLWIVVMYFGNASTLVFFYYGLWWCILECRLPLALFIMEYGDLFWKCKLLVLFIMHCGDVFWKCKWLGLNLVMIFANESCWSSLKVTSYV